MNRAHSIAARLLEVEEPGAFDPRAYFLDPEAKTTQILEDIKRKLLNWYDWVDIYPAVEGTATFQRFFDQGNRYRLRCKRVTPIPPEEYGERRGAARRFRDGIANSIRAILVENEYRLGDIEFAGNTFTNLLIILDMWRL